MSRLKQWILYCLTWSYTETLYFSTISPIDDILDNQGNFGSLREKLIEFRNRKEQEFKFVSLAVRVDMTTR